MASKTRRKVHSKKRTGGSKKRPMRRTMQRTMRRIPHYGGALTDYVPGYSYLPGKESLPGYNFYKGIKAGYDLVASVGNVYDNNDPEISTSPPIPPVPKGGHPLRKGDIAHNRKIQSQLPDPTYDSKAMLDQMNAASKSMPQTRAEETKGILQTIRKYKPIGTIDKVLQDLGLRDSVRQKLGQHKLGRFLIHGADTAMKFGFGRKKVTRRKKYGGSKTRRTYRRGRGLHVV